MNCPEWELIPNCYPNSCHKSIITTVTHPSWAFTGTVNYSLPVCVCAPPHLPGPSWPSALPPGSRLQVQLRSPPRCTRAARGETCHRSAAAWRRFCTGSVGRGTPWRTGLWAAAAPSAARRQFYLSVSSLGIVMSEDVSSGRRSPTLFGLWLYKVMCGLVNCACVKNTTCYWSERTPVRHILGPPLSFKRLTNSSSPSPLYLCFGCNNERLNT